MHFSSKPHLSLMHFYQSKQRSIRHHDNFMSVNLPFFKTPQRGISIIFPGIAAHCCAWQGHYIIHIFLWTTEAILYTYRYAYLYLRNAHVQWLMYFLHAYNLLLKLFGQVSEYKNSVKTSLQMTFYEKLTIRRRLIYHIKAYNFSL